jgi:serine/threonine protein kinase
VCARCSLVLDIYDMDAHGRAPTSSRRRRYVMVLVDYGASGTFHAFKQHMATRIGTPDWAPPEFDKDARYTAGWDSWGLGLLTLQFNTGCVPFQDRRPRKKDFQVTPAAALQLPRRHSRCAAWLRRLGGQVAGPPAPLHCT